jgi:uncharacterized repeat protein (TIGR03803 family)
MRSIMKHRASAFGIYLCAGSVALALLIVLVPTSLVAQADQAQSYKVLHTFTGTPDGKFPTGALLRDDEGNLFGTTSSGGAYHGGTIFKLAPDGTETILYSFTGDTDGASPESELIRDPLGNLYGTATSGGAFHGGTVFKLDSIGALTVLHSFTGRADGSTPWAGLVMDSAGNLYGSTFRGGRFRHTCWGGVIFEIASAGDFHVLYNFTCGADGAGPEQTLIRDQAGNFYGTASYNGAYEHGVVFKFNRMGLTVLEDFPDYFANGDGPSQGLVRDADGNLYGNTGAGGTYGFGTVFKLDSTGNETLLHSFEDGSAGGGWPLGGLVRDQAGNLYGVAGDGGDLQSCANGCGVVFMLDPSGNETVLHTFHGGTDGWEPYGALIRDSAGNLYGTTWFGGTSNRGTVFRIKP